MACDNQIIVSVHSRWPKHTGAAWYLAHGMLHTCSFFLVLLLFACCCIRKIQFQFFHQSMILTKPFCKMLCTRRLCCFCFNFMYRWGSSRRSSSCIIWWRAYWECAISSRPLVLHYTVPETAPVTRNQHQGRGDMMLYQQLSTTAPRVLIYH